MMGLASIIAGMLQTSLVHKFGRKNSAWLGLTIFAIGVPIFATGNSVAITLPATLFLSAGFTITINNAVTQLSHHYPTNSDLSISQMNGVNSAGYVAGTVVVGTLAFYDISWRLGLLACVPMAMFVYYFGHNKIKDSHDHEASKQSGKLSREFWIAWIGFYASISSEFATTFWAATLIMDRTGTGAAISTLCIATVGTGMGIGRWFGPAWLRKLTVDQRITAFLTIQMISFIAFWLSHNLTLSIFLLFVIGLGISGQFSMSSVRLIRLSEGRPDLAMGISANAAGIAIASAPFLLAFVGDHIGISRAYLIVPFYIALSYLAIRLVSSEVPQQR
jgi:predicted MFS family arabinose efflux permease